MSKYKALKQSVLEANLELVQLGLVIFTFGNVSQRDRDTGLIAIKPSGVPYETMRADDMVVLTLEGERVEGSLNPSSDVDTHLALYRAFDALGGVAHTHSQTATAWAQAGKGIPCFGTTQSDYCHGEIPVTRLMTDEEIRGRYEHETGLVLIERMKDADILGYPGALVHSHGPFSWGVDGAEAVHNAAIIEYCAKLALMTLQIKPEMGPMQQTLHDKHYFRKHGENAYYGQRTGKDR